MDGSAAGSTSNITNATSITTNKNTNKKTNLKTMHPSKDGDNSFERTPFNNSSPLRPRTLFGSNNGKLNILNFYHIFCNILQSEDGTFYITFYLCCR